MSSLFFETIPFEILEKVRHLDLSIKSRDYNKDIKCLLERTVLMGGKRLRPLLTYLFGDLFGVSLDGISPFARAIELVHAASLAHDDVIDSATTRRGFPSINIVASNKKAVLSGDYLLANVMMELTNIGNISLLKEMARIIQDLADGEWLQLDLAQNKNYSWEAIQEVARKKTGSVMSFCSVAPAYLAGLPSNLTEYSRTLGVNLGVAFQLIDDTLDFSKKSEKDSFSDEQNGIINSVMYTWLKNNPSEMEKFKRGEKVNIKQDVEGMNSAIQTVRDSADEKLEESLNLLRVIYKELNITDTTRAEKALRPLEKIIYYLGKRDY